MDFHIDWGTCGEDATTEETSMWRYVPDDGCHIDIRSIPAIAGGRHGLCIFSELFLELWDRPFRTNERLVAGEVFRVSETFEGSDGTLFLKLADGRGWVFESKAGIGTLCVRCQSDSDPWIELRVSYWS